MGGGSPRSLSSEARRPSCRELGNRVGSIWSVGPIFMDIRPLMDENVLKIMGMKTMMAAKNTDVERY